jgi:signal transduction histidine kinase
MAPKRKAKINGKSGHGPASRDAIRQDAVIRDPACHDTANRDAVRHDAVTQGAVPDAARHEALRSEVESLRADRDQAVAASQAKTAFLATISHELRTPLNGIIGFAEMIAREQLGAIGEKRYPAYANDIVTSARRLMHVLGDILDMARLESGRTEVFRETITFGSVIDEVMLLVRERAPADCAPIQVEVPADLPDLWTDRRHLRQILVNLLTNALAFTGKDGRVTLGARSAAGQFEVTVADTGVGMTPEEVKAAVTRFGNPEDPMARKNQGIGLGLPLAKSLTELLGGTMVIESERGQGTTVSLVFAEEAMRERAFEWKKPTDRTAERLKKFAEKQGAEN